jgi:hypothetical protein
VHMRVDPRAWVRVCVRGPCAGRARGLRVCVRECAYSCACANHSNTIVHTSKELVIIFRSHFTEITLVILERREAGRGATIPEFQ